MSEPSEFDGFKNGARNPRSGTASTLLLTGAKVIYEMSHMTYAEYSVDPNYSTDRTFKTGWVYAGIRAGFGGVHHID